MFTLFKLKRIAIISSFSTLLLSAGTFAEEGNKNKLPEIGAAGFSTLSIDKEQNIGNAMMRSLRASQPLINDPVLNEYMNDLGNRMVKYAQDVNYSFEFFLLNHKELNAFAFFGGHVGVHSGLVTTADTESELASVLAHEISHVTQRHLARRLEAQKRAQPLSTAGMLSSILLALVNPSVGMAAITTTMAASKQAGINFTRGNEKEADSVGISLLSDSGFDPRAAAKFFNKMAEKYRYKSKPPPMLLTHPLPESRIANARLRAQSLPIVELPPSLHFELAKARIKARYEGNSEDNIIQYQSDLTKRNYKIKAAAQYGLALSYFKDKNYKKAQEILEWLNRRDQKNLFYVDALADVYIQIKSFDKAIVMLSDLNLLMPNNQVVTLNYANVLSEGEKFAQAEVLLQDFLLVKPDNFIAYDLLTTVYRKMDKTALMHATKAETLALYGRYDRAIDELQTGYNFAKGKPLIKKRINARILQFQAQEDKLKRL
jgi:predicted Zn-dependent protease